MNIWQPWRCELHAGDLHHLKRMLRKCMSRCVTQSWIHRTFLLWFLIQPHLLVLDVLSARWLVIIIHYQPFWIRFLSRILPHDVSESCSSSLLPLVCSLGTEINIWASLWGCLWLKARIELSWIYTAFVKQGLLPIPSRLQSRCSAVTCQSFSFPQDFTFFGTEDTSDEIYESAFICSFRRHLGNARGL